LGSNRPERLARFTRFQCEDESCFADSARQFFRFVQLTRFALGALLLESIELTQRARGDLVCLAAR
jgi:hypothetical protein